MANPLRRYKLTGPPFDLARLDTERIGRNREWSDLKRIVDGARQSRSPVMGVLLGDYGAGKTFLLWHLAVQYRPALQSRVLACRPIRLLAPEQKRAYVRDLVIRFFRRGDVTEELREIVPRFLAKRSRSDPPEDLEPWVKLLRAFGEGDHQMLAKTVLFGGRILKREAENAGLVGTTQIKENHDAISLLHALQWLVKQVGVDVVALLIDEMEFLENQAPKNQLAILDSIKDLWDQDAALFGKGTDAAQLAIVMSSTPTAWAGLNKQVSRAGNRGEAGVGVTPFLRRISGSNVVEIDHDLGKEEARKLIVSRMSTVRSGKPRQPIIPFTDDYVEYIYALSKGLPRTIIEICGVVIDEAARREFTKITRKRAEEILQDLMLAYEPLDE